MSAHLTSQTICLMLGFAVAACAPGQPSATGPAASNGLGASSSPAATQPQDLGAAEVSLRQDDRARAGLVNLGPRAPELAGLMDASGAHALQDAVTWTRTLIAGPTSAAPTGRLVSDNTPGTAIFAPWTIATLAYEGSMSQGVSNTRLTNDEDTLGGCTSGFGSCSDPAPVKKPSEMSDTYTDPIQPTEEHVTVAGQPGVIRTTSTVTTTVDGSRIAIDIEIKVSGEIHDANGATIYRINSTGKGHIDGDACPDASGIATAHISFSASESYFSAASGAGGFGLQEDFSANVRIRADDNANLAGVEIIAKAHETSSGGLGAAGAPGELTPHELNAGATFTLPNDPATGFGPSVVTGVSTDSTAAASLLLGMGIFAQLPAKAAAKAAETAWRSGMCVRVSPSPAGGDVAKDSTTEVNVTVRQRYDGLELNKPVTATLSGPKSIEPAGQAQPAPATFSYTAGPKDKDTGTVTFKSVSNRGIGQTTVYFQVGGGWKIAPSTSGIILKGQKCGGFDGKWTITGTLKDAQLDQASTWVATISGTTLQGTYTLKSVTKSFPGAVTTITGTGRASVVAQTTDGNGYLAGTLDMTLFGTRVTSTAVGFDTEQTAVIPIPDQHFHWMPGGICP